MKVNYKLMEELRSEYRGTIQYTAKYLANYASIALDNDFHQSFVEAIADMLDSDIDEALISEGRQIRFLVDLDLLMPCSTLDEYSIQIALNSKITKCKRLRKNIVKKYPEEFDYRFISGISKCHAIDFDNFNWERNNYMLYGIFIYKLVEPEFIDKIGICEDRFNDFLVIRAETLNDIYSNLEGDLRRVVIKMNRGEKISRSKLKNRYQSKPIIKSSMDPMDEIMELPEDRTKSIQNILDSKEFTSLRKDLRAKMRKLHNYKF